MNDDDDFYTKTAWQAYQSSLGDKYRDALNKAIYETKLDASGLLVEEEKKRIAAKVKKEKLLDDLFNPDATMAVTSSYRTNTIMGKNPTTVWYDDPWDI
jgi:hypothetical protein